MVCLVTDCVVLGGGVGVSAIFMLAKTRRILLDNTNVDCKVSQKSDFSFTCKNPDLLIIGGYV